MSDSESTKEKGGVIEDQEGSHDGDKNAADGDSSKQLEFGLKKNESLKMDPHDFCFQYFRSMEAWNQPVKTTVGERWLITCLFRMRDSKYIFPFLLLGPGLIQPP